MSAPANALMSWYTLNTWTQRWPMSVTLHTRFLCDSSFSGCHHFKSMWMNRSSGPLRSRYLSPPVLDFCNVLLAGSSDLYSTFRTFLSDITPFVRWLHGLPISARIRLKKLVLTSRTVLQTVSLHIYGACSWGHVSVSVTKVSSSLSLAMRFI